jgi:phospholipase C
MGGTTAAAYCPAALGTSAHSSLARRAPVSRATRSASPTPSNSHLSTGVLMKFICSAAILLAVTAGLAFAQTIQPGTFEHIIIVVQENRTTDDLFGAGSSVPLCGREDPGPFRIPGDLLSELLHQQPEREPKRAGC